MIWVPKGSYIATNLQGPIKVELHSKDTCSRAQLKKKKVENEKGLAIVSIRSDHGGEFENDEFEEFCNEKGLDHNFSTPRTPHQNGIVERKN
ncbi:Integrase [Theobroma cacao]|nr:Integrase [Theobroma cacao]